MSEELFISSMEFCATPEGKSLFPDYQQFCYHTANVRPRLIKAGAMTMVGARVKVRPMRFMEAWQELAFERAEEKMKQA